MSIKTTIFNLLSIIICYTYVPFMEHVEALRTTYDIRHTTYDYYCLLLLLLPTTYVLLLNYF